MERYYTELAEAFVRGRLRNPAATIEDGQRAGWQSCQRYYAIELWHQPMAQWNWRKT